MAATQRRVKHHTHRSPRHPTCVNQALARCSLACSFPAWGVCSTVLGKACILRSRRLGSTCPRTRLATHRCRKHGPASIHHRSSSSGGHRSSSPNRVTSCWGRRRMHCPRITFADFCPLILSSFSSVLGGSHLRPNGPRHSWIPVHTSRWEAMCFRTDGLVDFNLRVALGRTG